MTNTKRTLELPARTMGCPFCGARPKLYRTVLGYSIVCESDKCKSRFAEVHADGIPEAVNIWNERSFEG